MMHFVLLQVFTGVRSLFELLWFSCPPPQMDHTYLRPAALFPKPKQKHKHWKCTHIYICFCKKLWVKRLISLLIKIAFSGRSKINWFAIPACFSQISSPDVCILCSAAPCNLTVEDGRAVCLVPCLVFFISSWNRNNTFFLIYQSLPVQHVFHFPLSFAHFLGNSRRLLLVAALTLTGRYCASDCRESVCRKCHCQMSLVSFCAGEPANGCTDGKSKTISQ